MAYLLAGGVAVVLAVGSCAGPDASDGATPVFVPTYGAGQSTGPRVAETSGVVPTEPVTEAIPRLEAAFTRAVRRAAPGAVMTGDEPFEIKYYPDLDFTAPREWDLFLPAYGGGASIRWHGRTNGVSFSIAWGHAVDMRCDHDTHDCRARTIAGRRVVSRMMGYEEEELSGDPKRESIEERLARTQKDTYLSFDVWVDRGDGSYVHLYADPANWNESVASRIPTLDLAVLEKIAMDPGLTVFP